MTLNKNTSPSFKGQHFFIGLNVHKKNWAVTIRLQKITLKKLSMDPLPEQLYKYLTTHYPDGVYHSVYEAGFCGYWIHRRLVELGIENIIVNAADIPTSHKEKDHRQDKIDSAKLAQASCSRYNRRLLTAPPPTDPYLWNYHIRFFGSQPH
jgi:hypothetical protein